MDHEYVDVQRNSDLLWERVEKANCAGFRMYCWEVKDCSGFQCHPYTNGWGVVGVDLISHRVLMQQVQHKKLPDHFWLNDGITSMMD